jgi:hypothetical protein
MRLVGPLVLLLLTGCYTPVEVKRQDYPLDWAKPAPAASGCPTLGGRYLNQGQGPHHYLASLVLPPTSTPMSQIDIVELDGPRNGALTLRFFAPPVQGRGEPPELGVRHWQQGEDFTCEDGWLVLSKTRVIPMGLFVTSDIVRFALAGDRSLVVEKREAGGGVVLVFPGYVSSRTWQRYPRME